MSIRDYFSRWDPMHFIAEGGPSNEYDAEADEVSRRFQPSMSKKEIGELIHQVFVEYMEIDPQGFERECLERAEDVRKILSNARK